MKLLLIYFSLCILLYSNTLEYVNEIQNSVFTINLQIKNKKNLIGNFCYVTRKGAKIDCNNSFEGTVRDKKVYFDFNSSFGGKNGKAVISFISEKQIEWVLLKSPQGEFYTPKQAILTLSGKKEPSNSMSIGNNYDRKDTCENKYIEENKYGYYIDYDPTLNIYGTFLFTDDLKCHIASSGREICLDNNSNDRDLICLKNIIANDIQKLFTLKKRLSENRINYYRLIFNSYDYKGTIYEQLFKKMFTINKILGTKNHKFLFTQYNDIAYYLQKAGANKEAVYLLEKIIKKFPNRTVAYINLGDAYWALGETEKARKAYTTYIEQMCNKGLQKKIPQEVLKRVERKDVCQ